MTVFGINGSPRKKWNTAKLLMESLEGAASQGASTELIHLYDLDYGEAETFCCYDTYQFPDYSKVIMEYMDPAKKAERRKEIFPDDCRKAFELGCRLYSPQGCNQGCQ